MLGEAQALLTQLGALEDGRITEHGRALARLPLHPRLGGHMLTVAGKGAAGGLAALLAERDPPLPFAAPPVDLSLRLEALNGPRRFAERRPWQANRGVIERVRAEAKRLARMVNGDTALSPAQMAALAYPDRVGLRRPPGDDPRYVLSGGKGGAVLDPEDTLAATRLIVVTDTDGNPREAKIRQAVAITEAELREVHGDQIRWEDRCHWSKRDRRVIARRQEVFGAVVLDDRIWKDAPGGEAVARAMLDGVRDLGGLRPPSGAAKRFLARVALVDGMPDMSDAALMDSLEDWLLPHLGRVKSAEDWKRFDILNALRGGVLDWNQMSRLDAEAPPAHFTTPMQRKVPIDYGGEHPLDRGAPAGDVRRGQTPESRAHTPPAHHASEPPRPETGADHDGPAGGVLGQFLCGCAQGHARTLPETSLAGRPAGGRSDLRAKPRKGGR